MAAAVPNINLPVICLLLVISIKLSYSGEYSGLLSRLYKKASQNNRPLILVLDPSGRGNVKDISKKFYQSSDENEDSNNPLMYLYQLAQSQKKKSLMKRPSKQKHTHVHEIKDVNKPKLRSRDRRERLRSRDNRFDSKDTHDEKDARENRILKSPVMKSLLRMANGLSCQARNECENKCDGKFNQGRQHDDCENKCEEKFGCEDEEKDDPCEDTEDECGAEETTTESCNVSTKGEILVDEGNKGCKRC